MRIFVFIIGFLFFSSAATLAAERVVLPEGEQLICTQRIPTHHNNMRVDDFGHPSIITSATNDGIKSAYEKWSKKRYKDDAIYKYTFTSLYSKFYILAKIEKQ